MGEEAALRRFDVALALIASANARHGVIHMPRPRCSIAAVAEARVRSRTGSVVGGGGARASRAEQQGRCHRSIALHCATNRVFGDEGVIAKGAATLVIQAMPVHFGAGGEHSQLRSGCEVGSVPQNGNLGSEQCAGARLILGEG